MEGFGQRLRILRLTKGYTQAELAEILNISPSAIGMYEHGRRLPNPDLLIHLNRVFRVSTDYLLGIERAPESVEDILKQIGDSISASRGLNFNGVELGKSDTRKLLDAINIAANVILNEKIRNAAED